MKKKLASLALLLTTLLLVAWTFNGTGNCSGWTVTQNENQSSFDYWTIDGVSGQIDDSVTSKFVADTSSATSRTFAVRWWDERIGPDQQEDAQTKTLTRQGCGTTTTTAAPTTTTTEAPSTTTTTEQPSTTTTEPPTTTTVTEGTSTSTTYEPTTTTTLPYDSVPPTTVAQTISTTKEVLPPKITELPFTGDWTLLLALGGTVMAAGGVRMVRKNK